MAEYPIYKVETAPEGSKATLAQVEKAYGFIPNLTGVLAASPTALKAYISLSSLFEGSSFTPTERQIVLLTVSFTNQCTYCMAAHSVISGMQGVSEEVVRALREGTALADEKLEALRSFTLHLLEKKGLPEASALAAFLAAGYDEAQVLEVITGIAMKTISNYTNHVADTPLDQAFQSAQWRPAT